MYKDKNKQRSYQKTWIRKRREEYFKNKECEWCGSTVKLVIHHENPKNKISHAVWSWGEARRNAELKKCVVLCDKCHRQYHTPKSPLIHGTRNAYHEKKCRCKKCREWSHDYMADYRKRKAAEATS